MASASRVEAGETLALVGESGCGKSTVGRLVLRLIEPTPAASASRAAICCALDANELRAFRRDAQLIFQDPYASLNPRMTVGADPGRAAGAARSGAGRAAARARRGAAASWSGCEPRFARALSARVLRRPAPAHRDRAGARGRAEADRLRRAGLGARRLDPRADPQPAARPAAAARPRLHLHLARSRGGEAHRRPRRRDVSRPHRRDRARPTRCSPHPRHPYTPRAAVGDPGAGAAAPSASRIVLQGDVPSPLNPPSGCHFHTRCPYAIERCRVERAALLADGTGHATACHRWRNCRRPTASCRPTAASRRRWSDWSPPSAGGTEGADGAGVDIVGHGQATA